MNLLMLIESKRERDLDLLGKMVELTDSSYRWDKTPDESNADYAIYGAVVLLAVMHSDGSKLSFANFGACSFSSAIDLLAIEPLQRLNTLDVETATRKLNRIAAKYRDRPLNPEKLSPQDKAIYLSLMNDTVNPALKTKDYLLALQNIKLMERASALIYSTSREEAAISGGDISAIGATIKTMMEQKKLDQEMQVAIALWYKLNEKYPAPTAVRLD